MFYLLKVACKIRLQTLAALLSATLLSIFNYPPAEAATLTLNLERTSALTNLNDAEGRWQMDGGRVLLGESLVGYYVRKKRVSFAVPSSINKAAVETTVIWGSGNYTFTLQGTHSFTDGSQVGSVSSASAGFTSMAEGIYSGTANQVTIAY